IYTLISFTFSYLRPSFLLHTPPPTSTYTLSLHDALPILKPQSYVVLDQVAASLVANPEIQIEIAGYTDNTGSPTLNRRLSQARADRVRAYLASKGVSPSRMIARGYGPANPIAPNTTAAGRAQNRRVELHKLP